MTITIYLSKCTLYQGDYIASEWIECRYFDRPKLAKRMETGFIKVREPLKPILIKAHFASVSEDGRWAKLMDGHCYDAEHVLCMAKIGKKGMKVVGSNPRSENQ